VDRNEWLKAVYVAACQVAEKHGPGLRAALESRDGRLDATVFQVAADAIAQSGELWPFITFSRHPEPAADAWRQAASFEGAAVQVAVAALAADIRDMLKDLSPSRALQLQPEKPGPGRPGQAAPKRKRDAETPGR
jgi:hypothetical protein